MVLRCVLNMPGFATSLNCSKSFIQHPARTWASSSHRKFTHAAVGIAMAAATVRFMQDTAKTVMRRVLGIRGGQGETLVPPTVVAGGDEGFVFESEASDNNNSGKLRCALVG